MPRSALPIWALGWLVMLTLPPVGLLYATAAPLGFAAPGAATLLTLGAMVVPVLLLPLFLGAGWFLLSRYNSETRLLAWRMDRPVRSALLTLLFGGLAAGLIAFLALNLPQQLRWYDLLLVGHGALTVMFLLQLRAAGICQHAPDREADIFA